MFLIIVGTPFLLLAIAHIGTDDWPLLSDVGQAYGGISAAVGTLALLGVVVSIMLQSREFNLTRQMVNRTIHAELLFRALDDPSLRACWGPSPHGAVDKDRQHLYSNLVVAFWRSMFDIGAMTEQQLRPLAAEMFAAEPGRRYWSVAGQYQLAYYNEPRDRSFIAILSEEYDKALAATSAGAGDQPRESQTVGIQRSAVPSQTLHTDAAASPTVAD
jgi:hypothetical protein